MVSTLDNLLLVLACLSGVNYVARGATTPAAPPERKLLKSTDDSPARTKHGSTSQ